MAHAQVNAAPTVSTPTQVQLTADEMQMLQANRMGTNKHNVFKLFAPKFYQNRDKVYMFLVMLSGHSTSQKQQMTKASLQADILANYNRKKQLFLNGYGHRAGCARNLDTTTNTGARNVYSAPDIRCVSEHYHVLCAGRNSVTGAALWEKYQVPI